MAYSLPVKLEGSCLLETVSGYKTAEASFAPLQPESRNLYI